VARARSHRDGCGIAHASDLLGQRWTLLVVRELLLGPKRFTDLRAGIPDLSPNVLAQRLRELIETGIVRKRELPPPAAVQVYELTEWGSGLEPVLLALGRWATGSAAFPGEVEMGPDSLVLALKSTFDPTAARGVRGTYAFVVAGLPYRIRVEDGRFAAERGEADSPDATIRGDPQAIAGVVFRGVPIARGLGPGGIEVDGDRRAAERLLRALAGA
jgi:DNA-binding HxlR family transcriptional regulator